MTKYQVFTERLFYVQSTMLGTVEYTGKKKKKRLGSYSLEAYNPPRETTSNKQ